MANKKHFSSWYVLKKSTSNFSIKNYVDGKSNSKPKITGLCESPSFGGSNLGGASFLNEKNCRRLHYSLFSSFISKIVCFVLMRCQLLSFSLLRCTAVKSCEILWKCVKIRFLRNWVYGEQWDQNSHSKIRRIDF